jgi:glycosyltransferase involved in cell wall biosynthesis
MEAMSAGLPCVVSNIRGNVDLIKHGKGGFLCGANEVDEYKKEAVKKFDIGVVVEQMKRIYNEA